MAILIRKRKICRRDDFRCAAAAIHHLRSLLCSGGVCRLRPGELLRISSYIRSLGSKTRGLGYAADSAVNTDTVASIALSDTFSVCVSGVVCGPISAGKLARSTNLEGEPGVPRT